MAEYILSTQGRARELLSIVFELWFDVPLDAVTVFDEEDDPASFSLP